MSTCSPAPSLSLHALAPYGLSLTRCTYSPPLAGSPPLSCLEHRPLPGPPQPPSSAPSCSSQQDSSVVYFQHSALCQMRLVSCCGHLKVSGPRVSFGGQVRQCPLAWTPCPRLETREGLNTSVSFSSYPALEGVTTASPGALEIERDLVVAEHPGRARAEGPAKQGSGREPKRAGLQGAPGTFRFHNLFVPEKPS